ncbi:MAG TPA: HD-GYP domain-containing protein [Candidatus Atribacteria bacterium]|nr:HD-GYP domain-containing protein [Candidatus Atribacteria bacterium]
MLSLASGISVKDEEKHLLREVANDIAFGLHNIELEEKDKLAEQKLQQSYQRLQKTMEGAINTIAKIVETKDPYTSGHQQRVSKLAETIARKMKLPQEKIEGIRISSLVHDVGKISVPAEILNKPIKLTEIEFNLIKDHSQAGYDILKSIKFPWPIEKIVLQHHERLDGSGYPRGLKGEDIIIEARIIGVADVVEAMSSHRPYRPALGVDAALEEISKNKGILYDPEAVDICIKLVREKGFEF